jgi:pyruvate dehydrogenase E2 component (dihydrolipoamide acetyltransferase)
MGQSDATVACTGCSRTYKWKPEYAGKKAKCKCGASVQFPKEPPAAPAAPAKPAAPAPQAGGEYDFHDPTTPTARTAPAKPAAKRSAKKGACIDCGKPLAPGAVLCMSCGMNQQTGRKLDTAIEKPPMALAAARAKGPEKTSGGAAKWIGIGAAAVVLGAGAYVAMYVYPGFAVEKAPEPSPRPTTVTAVKHPANSEPAATEPLAATEPAPTSAAAPATAVASTAPGSEVPDPPPG